MDVTIDTSTVYSTFYMDKLTKIYRHRWKENLKISNLAKFESAPHHTNACKISRLSELYLRSFLSYHSQMRHVYQF